MRPVLKTIVIAGVFLTSLFGLGLDRGRLAAAEEETKVSHSRRGGLLLATEEHRFEVFFYPTGVRVFPLDADGKAVDTSRLTASASVSYPGAPPERWLARPLHPVPTEKGVAPTSLVASIDLADAPQKTTTVVFEIGGLPGATASAAAFKIPLEFVAKAAATPTNTSSESRPIARLGYEGNRSDVVSGPGTSSQPAEAMPAYTGTLITSSTSSTTSTSSTSSSGTSKSVKTSGIGQRDWTTGRNNLPLSRPWLPSKD